MYPEWRLDRLLQRKAQQGVRIYVQVYKEVSCEPLLAVRADIQVTASMSLGSKHTKVSGTVRRIA